MSVHPPLVEHIKMLNGVSDHFPSPCGGLGSLTECLLFFAKFRPYILMEILIARGCAAYKEATNPRIETDSPLAFLFQAGAVPPFAHRQPNKTSRPQMLRPIPQIPRTTSRCRYPGRGAVPLRGNPQHREPQGPASNPARRMHFCEGKRLICVHGRSVRRTTAQMDIMRGPP